MKKCFKCGEEKDLSDFYKHGQMADGHLNKCKDCVKQDVRQHRKVNESVREYDRQRYRNDPARRERGQRNASAWNKKHPERYRAHNAVNNAVRDGKLTKEPCEVCGGKAHAHHDDYSKPLDVRWLCPKHHQRHHARIKD